MEREKSLFDSLYERRIFEGIVPKANVLEEFLKGYEKDLPFVLDVLSAIERMVEQHSLSYSVSDKVKTVNERAFDFMTWRIQVAPAGQISAAVFMSLAVGEIKKTGKLFSARFGNKKAHTFLPSNYDPSLASQVAVAIRFSASKALIDKSIGGDVYDVIVSVPRPNREMSVRSRYLIGPDSRGRYELRNEYCYVIYTPYSSIDVKRIYDDWREHMGDNNIYLSTRSGEKVHRAWEITAEHFGRGTTYEDIKEFLDSAGVQFYTTS